jgi:hypothetical protein
MKLAAPFALLFVVLVALFPTTGFYDLYLLPWQTRSIFLQDANFWHAMRDDPSAYLPFTHFSALPYGPLFYYPTGIWIRTLDAVHVIDMRGWTNLGGAAGSLRYTALLKVPNLLVYAAIAAVLLGMFPGRGGVDAMLLWLLNPAVILVSFVMGQNDGWSMLTVLAALLLARGALGGQRDVRVGPLRVPAAALAMCLLGAGGAIKLHPLLFVAPFALVLGRSWPERLGLAATAGATFAACIAPFVSDPFFRDQALFNPQGQDILRYKIGPLALFYPAYAAALLPLARRDRPWLALLCSVATVHLVVFALTDWPPERAAWFIGVLAPAAVLHRAALATYVLVTLQVLLHAMTLGGALGADAFSVLSPRLANGPGLDAAIDRVSNFDAVQAVALGVAAPAWCAAVAGLMFVRQERPRPIPVALPAAMLLLLPLWFAASLAYTSGGVTSDALVGDRGVVDGPADVQQLVLAAGDGLSAVEVRYDAGAAPQPLDATLDPGDGSAPRVIRALPSARPRWLKLGFDTIPASSRKVYVLTLHLPAGAKLGTVRMTGQLVPARIGGTPSPDRLVDLRQHYDRNWTAVWRDVQRSVRGEAGVWLATAVMMAVPLGLLWRAAERAMRGGETNAPVAAAD